MRAFELKTKRDLALSLLDEVDTLTGINSTKPERESGLGDSLSSSKQKLFPFSADSERYKKSK